MKNSLMKRLFGVVIFTITIILYNVWFTFDWKVFTLVMLLLWANNVDLSCNIEDNIIKKIKEINNEYEEK